MKQESVCRSAVPPLAVWKVEITRNGISSFFDKKIFEQKFPNIKIKHAIKNPKSIDNKVFDESCDQKVIPSEVIITDKKGKSSIVKLRYNPTSAISLFLPKTKNDKIVFRIQKDKNITTLPLGVTFLKETPNSIVSLVGKDRLSIILFDGCWNWNIGTQCHFCDLNPKRKNYKSVIPNLNDLVTLDNDYKKWWQQYKIKYFSSLKKSLKEAYKLASPHKHLLIMSGGFIDNEFLWQMIIELLEKINSIIPLKNFDNLLNSPPPTKKIKDKFLKIKALGIKQVQFNLEVIGEEQFKETCPGKSNAIGYNNFKKALKIGAKIFGKGHSRSNFVFTSRTGSKLIQEATSLAKDGIVMDYSIFQPKRGTFWSNKKSPSVNEIIKFNIKLAKIYKRNNFSGIYCNLSSRSSVINEFLDNDY